MRTGKAVFGQSAEMETSRSMIAMRYADCGFIKMPVGQTDLSTAVMMRDDHPLARRLQISPKDIGDMPMILLSAGRRCPRKVDAAFAKSNMHTCVTTVTQPIARHVHLPPANWGWRYEMSNRRSPLLHGPLVTRLFTP